MGTCCTRCHSNTDISENPQVDPSATQENVIVSLHDYPTFEQTEPSMHAGERLTVLLDDGDFMMVRSTCTGREVYIPTNYTATITHRWLFNISRYKAEELLQNPNNHTGAFLIRNSETTTGSYSLSVLIRTHSSRMSPVKHYRIFHLPNTWLYISPGLTFPSLHSLVEHYSEYADGLCCKLTVPCFIRGLDDTRPAPTVIRRPTINWKDISRSMIMRRKRTESGHSLVSEGLRDAISSYLQMTEGDDQFWDT